MSRPAKMSSGHVHLLLRDLYGPARNHVCPCGEQAEEWAYQHTAVTVLRNRKGSPYSTDLNDYRPMCRRCHRRLDADSYRASGHQRGLYAGALTADKVRTDPAYAAKMTANLGDHLRLMKEDPEYRSRYRGYMRRTNLKRYRCQECEYENNAGNMGWHRKKTGHHNIEEVVHHVQ